MMRLVTRTPFTKRKIVFVFLLAILFPMLIVGYLSFDTFFQRRETVRRLLESNLQASGESALRAIEEILREYEKAALKPDNFHSLSAETETLTGKLFLLDDRFQIVVPRTAPAAESFLSWQEDLLNDPFADAHNLAEHYEFSQQDYARAAELYRQCLSLAASPLQKAIALDGLGRSFLSSRWLGAAYDAYRQLATDYPQFPNKSGHPYGISAAFQMHAIDRSRKQEENSCRILLDLYRNIRNGTWPLSLTTYDFFVSEIESCLDDLASQERFPDVRQAFNTLRRQPSPFRQVLRFTDSLNREAVPVIKERLTLKRTSGEAPSGRFPVELAGEFGVISFNLLPQFQDDKTFTGGFLWDMEPLRDTLLPDILDRVSLTTGLQLSLSGPEEGLEPNSGIEAAQGPTASPEAAPAVSLDTIALSFQAFPFPWKLRVTQPAFAEQERAARRENLFYGILLAVIVALILFGASLIARDIARESETIRLRSEFVRNVSHEFKTPLSMIRLYAETLERKHDLTPRQKKDAYQIITKESERLSHMINNVLDLSRIEMGRKEFHFETGDLAGLVRETLDSYRYHLEKKGFAIHADIASGLPAIRFDREAMASVVINLLSNAMKFSSEHKDVSLRLFLDNSRAVLQVADKGIGIAPREQDRIFERFYRVSDKAASESRGSGLGLPLVKHIVEAHGGEVRVESAKGEGSTFSVLLPLQRTENGDTS